MLRSKRESPRYKIYCVDIEDDRERSFKCNEIILKENNDIYMIYSKEKKSMIVFGEDYEKLKKKMNYKKAEKYYKKSKN